MSELLWVAVPGGIADNGAVLLRVLVVPMLDGGTLAGSGMRTWPPPELGAATLTVEWRADDDAPVQRAEVPPADVTFHAQPGLWPRLFDPATPVGDRQRAVAAHPKPDVRPTSADADRIATTYAGPARIELDPQAATLPAAYDESQLQVLKEWKHSGPPPRGTAPDTTPRPPPDFHRVISLLREHPAVLRGLGLIFELRPTPPAGLEAAGQVRVRWLRDDPPPAEEEGGPFDHPRPSIVSPWTRYGRAFRPGARDGTISAGMVTLTPDPGVPEAVTQGTWTVITVDVEGGTRRLRDAAALVNDDDGESAAQADQRRPVSLPAMRSAGLQLVRPNRSEDFARRGEIARANLERETLDGHVLDATDLVLGYRIDVKRGGGEWRSLHERTATYEVDGVTIGEGGRREEGHQKAMGAVRENDGVLRADEVVARWSGWSLSVPRPRFGAPADGSGPSPRGGLPFTFSWKFTVPPGSLPVLRFTDTYAMRARVVDIAGGGLELDDPAADRCQITDIPYGRHEPVPSPTLTLEPGVEPGSLGPGEAVDHVVVRSGPGADVDDFAAGNPGYVTTARRLLHRPQTSLEIAEQHNSLRDFDDARMAVLVRSVLAASAGEPAPPGDGPLPDPAASGVRAFARPEPGAPAAAVASREWTTKPWPETDGPKLLELRDRLPGETPMTFEAETLVVRLAPAEQLTVDISSSLTGDFLDHFALQEQLPALSKTTAKVGGHPLITPSRPVTLVHAVRRPLRAPDEAGRLQTRQGEPGQTFAIFDPEPPFLGIDANSTAQLDITASWIERHDDKVRQVTGVPVQSIVVNPGDTGLKDQLRQEFGDTRHRDVTYTLTAASRFRQHFDADEDPLRFLAATTLVPTTILSTARPAAPVVLATRPAFTWTESVDTFPETMDPASTVTVMTRQRLGGRLRLELARPWYQTGDGERLALLLWARPEADPADQGMLGYVTQAGRDPIWETPAPVRWPDLSMLGGDVAGAPAWAFVPETGLSVLAVPYEPWFHNDRWYADIALPGVAASSYCPFVQLAVGRYQPGSLSGLSLSPVVRTEMVQLLPDRTLTVKSRLMDLDHFVVTLDGAGPTGPQANRVDIVLERGAPAPGMDIGAVDLTALGPTNGGIPAWVPVPGATRHAALGEEVEMQIPPGDGALRIRVREVEQVGQDGPPPPQAGTPGEMTERVPFTDIVRVPVL